jgi:hypothetical protein
VFEDESVPLKPLGLQQVFCCVFWEDARVGVFMCFFFFFLKEKNCCAGHNTFTCSFQILRKILSVKNNLYSLHSSKFVH